MFLESVVDGDLDGDIERLTDSCCDGVFLLFDKLVSVVLDNEKLLEIPGVPVFLEAEVEKLAVLDGEMLNEVLAEREKVGDVDDEASKLLEGVSNVLLFDKDSESCCDSVPDAETLLDGFFALAVDEDDADEVFVIDKDFPILLSE